MNKSKGFTLIELVIVIVILGILGAVAAPRLFNLQGDAYGANLNAMKSSISSAMTIANAKAQIEGKLGNNVTDVTGYDQIKFVAGYPAATRGLDAKTAGPGVNAPGILATLTDFDDQRYTLSGPAAGPLVITPKAATNPADCKVIYTQAKPATTGTTSTSAEPAKVEAVTTGC